MASRDTFALMTVKMLKHSARKQGIHLPRNITKARIIDLLCEEKTVVAIATNPDKSFLTLIVPEVIWNTRLEQVYRQSKSVVEALCTLQPGDYSKRFGEPFTEIPRDLLRSAVRVVFVK